MVAKKVVLMAFNAARFLWALVGYFISFMMVVNTQYETGMDTTAYTFFVRGSIFALILMTGHYLVTHK